MLIDRRPHTRLPEPTRSARCRSTPRSATRWPRSRCPRRSTTRARSSSKPSMSSRSPRKGRSRTSSSWSTAGSCRAGSSQGRSAADLRGDRPHQARPGLARIHGPRTLPHERLPDPAGGRTQGDDAIHADLQARPRRRRVQLSVQHPEVHRQADPEAGAAPPDREPRPDQVDLQPGRRRRTSTAPSEHEATRPTRAARRRPRPTSGWSTRSPKGRSGRRC